MARRKLVLAVLTAAASAWGCDEDFDDCPEGRCGAGASSTGGVGAGAAGAGGSAGGGAGGTAGGAGDPGGTAGSGGAVPTCVWDGTPTLVKSLAGAGTGATTFGPIRVERRGLARRIYASPGGALTVYDADGTSFATGDVAAIRWSERSPDAVTVLVESEKKLALVTLPDVATTGAGVTRDPLTVTPIESFGAWSRGRFVRDGVGGAFVVAVREYAAVSELVRFHWQGTPQDPTPFATDPVVSAVEPTGLARVGTSTHLFSRTTQRIEPDVGPIVVRPAPSGGELWAAPVGDGIGVAWIGAGGLRAGTVPAASVGSFDPAALPPSLPSPDLSGTPYAAAGVELRGEIVAVFGPTLASKAELRGLVSRAGTTFAVPPRDPSMGTAIGAAAWAVANAASPTRLHTAWVETLPGGTEVLYAADLVCP